MARIDVQNLTFGYDGSADNVFSGVSFAVDTDWKLGLIGRNGRGKTTFLALLRGLYPYGGTITAPVRFHHYPQKVADPALCAREAALQLAPGALEWQLRREMAKLELDEEILDRPFSSLSGGEAAKLMLSVCFLEEGAFPLIDEPTNHLDARGREVVGDYLAAQRGFIVVSHDRAFLDRCVDHILSINRAGIEVMRGNFTTWLLQKERQDRFELEQNERLKGDIVRLREAAQRTARWSDKVERSKIGSHAADRGAIGHKAAKMMKRSKSTERRQLEAAEQKEGLLKNLEKADPLMIYALRAPREILVRFERAVLRYGDRDVCGPLSFEVRRGDRLAITGRNGSGKTSVLKCILGQLAPHEGRAEVSGGLTLSHVSQDTSHLRGGMRAFAREQGLDESLFFAILRKLDLPRAQFEKDLAEASEGQKKKVLIAASLSRPAHLYLWDEPLNYVDLLSRMQLEELIKSFEPTMVLVEHDRAFLDAVATAKLAL